MREAAEVVRALGGLRNGNFDLVFSPQSWLTRDALALPSRMPVMAFKMLGYGRYGGVS